MLFQHSFALFEPFRIVFLCGSHYSDKDSDKRRLLKAFLEASCSNLKAVILEEHFDFKPSKKDRLKYDDAFLSNLRQVEELASLFADKIIIIHESISTAAELGMFLADPAMDKRICLLTPDELSIDEQKITAFIDLAFLHDNDHVKDKDHIHKIKFYPDIELTTYTSEINKYHTFFHENQIGENLGTAIMDFILPPPFPADETVCFNNSLFHNFSKTYNIDYYNDGDTLRVSVHPYVLRVQLLSMFGLSDIRTRLRTKDTLRSFIFYLVARYKELLRNTVMEKEARTEAFSSVSVSVKDAHCSIDQAVGYFLYLLQAAGFISILTPEKNDMTTHKIEIKTTLDALLDSIPQLIRKEKPSPIERFIHEL